MLIKKCGSSYAIFLVQASCPKTREMKNILVMTLLVTGLAGNIFVYGQVKRDSMHRQLLPPGKTLWVGDSVRIMGPDKMRCLVPSLAGVERMPIKKLDSKLVRPMPNGIQPNGPRVMVIPKKKVE